MGLGTAGVLGIEAAGAIATGATSGLFGINQAKKNRAFQERMYNKQLEDNRENWRMVNEYNLPSAVRQRYEDAGLNPLLLYPEGASTGLTSVASPSAPSGAQANTPAFANPFQGFTQSYQSMKKLDTEIDLMKAQEMKTLNEGLAASAQFVKSHAEAENIQKQTEYTTRNMENQLALTHAEARLKNIMADAEEWKIDEIKKSIEKADAEIDLIGATITNNNKMTDQQIAESQNRIKNANKVTAQQIATMKAEERKALADAMKAKEEASVVRDTHDSVVAKYHNDLLNAVRSGTAQDIENAMNQLVLSRMPKEGSPAWKWQRFFENWVTPVTGSLGALLGGAIGGFTGSRSKR